jgi:sulfite oxidase
LIDESKILTLEDLETGFKQYTIEATLLCAGNRRTEMDKFKKVSGLGWGAGAVSHGVWTGVKLGDVLRACKVREGKDIHVEFLACDWSEESNSVYGSSIPLSTALDPLSDVLLATGLNGKPLTRDNGYPVRVICPGIIGARAVKWVTSIEVKEGESENFYQKTDYKVLIPSVDKKELADEEWDKSQPIQGFNVNSAICNITNGAEIAPGSFTLKGYAYSSSGIQRVEVSTDKGETWMRCELIHPGLRYDNS